MPTFKLHITSDEKFSSQLATTKVPWVQLQAPGLISFMVSADFARSHVGEPTKTMNLWKHSMQVLTEVSGYGTVRPWMEVFVFDPKFKEEGKKTKLSFSDASMQNETD